MNFFGIGGWELIAFLLIALVVAGPRRMIQWAYVVGVYTAKFRAMWSETVKLLEKEFKNAGVDVEIPKQLPTSRSEIRQQVNKAFKPITNPLEETVKEVNTSLQLPSETQPAPKTDATNGVNAASNASSQNNTSFGTWSGKTEK